MRNIPKDPPARTGRLYIGVCGKAYHGKSSLCQALRNHFHAQGFSVSVTAFATVPKKMLYTLGLHVDQLWGPDKEKPTDLLQGRTPRFAMRTLATEWGRRMLYDEIWVDAWQREVDRDITSEIILIEDVRHETEINRLRELGAILVEVHRPALVETGLRAWWRSLFAHSSETLNFQRLGIPRLIVEEGDTVATLKKFLEAHLPVQ